MKQLLLVEDSPMIGRLTKTKLESVFDIPVYWVRSMEETIKLLDKAKGNFAIALLDFSLPDAPNGEVIDAVISRGITVFVFTGIIDENVRKQVWSKKVADYVLKEDPNCLDYIMGAMRRIENNSNHIILVVSDDDHDRTMISELLYVHKYRVLTSRYGDTALAIIDKYKDIKLVITDYNLPDMEGWSFCQRAREKLKHDDLAIIGFVTEGGIERGVRFIKSGASDFLIKDSFVVEEFYCRITQNIETVDLIRKTKDIAIKDHLTGLYNRRYFFDAGKRLFACSKRDQVSLVCAMVDIDHFKQVNDTYGHGVGDIVIKKVAEALVEKTRATDIIARIGGEEFCILAVDMTPEGAREKFENLRQRVESMLIESGDGETTLQVTISVGVSTIAHDDFGELIKSADLLLYNAKENGRNQVALF